MNISWPGCSQISQTASIAAEAGAAALDGAEDDDVSTIVDGREEDDLRSSFDLSRSISRSKSSSR